MKSYHDIYEFIYEFALPRFQMVSASHHNFCTWALARLILGAAHTRARARTHTGILLSATSKRYRLGEPESVMTA